MKLRNKKTGEIQNVWTYYEKDKGLNIKYFTDDGVVNLEYDSLAELNEDWEDYKPAEPLIKDEKIRKAVRAWAEASDIGVVRVIDDYCFKDSESDACIRFYDKIGVYLEGNYTIAELCGEEKE